MNPPFGQTTLANGIRVVTETHPHFKSASVGIFVHRGSRDEGPRQFGLSHLVEHMVFKGTKSRTALQIAETLEGVGGDINAFTSKEQTCFHALALAKDLPQMLGVLSDLLCNASHSAADLALEKSVIEHEIQMSSDQLEDAIFDLFFEEFYHGSSLAHPILGTPQSLNSITREELVSHYSTQYRGRELVVAGAGPFSHAEFLTEVEKNLGHLPPYTGKPMFRQSPEPRAFGRYVERPSEQVHILFGVPSIDFSHRLKTTGIVANLALGAGMTSHLYQKIREEKGLAYSVFSSLQMFSDTGLLFLYAGTSGEQAEEVLSLLVEETNNFLAARLTDERIEFFKNQLIGQLTIASDDVENRMQSIGTNEQLLGRYRGVDEIVSEVEKIDAAAIGEFLNAGIDRGKSSLMMLGRVDENIQPAMDRALASLRGNNGRSGKRQN